MGHPVDCRLLSLLSSDCSGEGNFSVVQSSSGCSLLLPSFSEADAGSYRVEFPAQPGQAATVRVSHQTSIRFTRYIPYIHIIAITINIYSSYIHQTRYIAVIWLPYRHHAHYIATTI